MSVSGAAGGAGAVVRTGHLRKLKTMKKKYFVLRADAPECSARLEYYESEKKYKSGAAPRRIIPLKSCYNITRRLDLKQRHVIALFTREEQFCIVAENEQDLHGWLTAILKQHRNDDASEELMHPIQHVWQVNVQKKGLGATKNIQGLYNLCLTDKTLSLVKIKSYNNVISDLGIPERVEYSLKNIRRCGDSECFFYMEVGRQTATGAGELWMHSDDNNIAQSMHSTIYHAMRNCAKESENERDHIVMPKRSDSTEGVMRQRGQTFSYSTGRSGLANDKGLCMGSCIRQCVCAGHADDSAAALAPLTPLTPTNTIHAENQPPNNSLTEPNKDSSNRAFKHHRTISLPTGCPFQEPLRISHGRTRSAPLTGDEVDRIIEKSTPKPVNGTDVFLKKQQWSRRASTGAGNRLLTKLSPMKNAGTLRNRCDSMPSRACSTFETERPQTRHSDHDVVDASRDETDSDWHRAPGIPEEPDFCDPIKELLIRSWRTPGGGGAGGAGSTDEGSGYLPMRPPLSAASASSGSLASGTPSTDHRFSEYQLEPATSHIVECERPPRAYSVGSRPAPRTEPRHRAYSVGSRARPHPHPAHPPHSAPDAASAPHLALHSYMHKPRASAADLMELDFSSNSPSSKPSILGGTPPGGVGCGYMAHRPRAVDEYVDMSPRYVDMRPDAPVPAPAPAPALAPAPAPAATPDGYVEMNYGRGTTRPIAIAGAGGRGAGPPPAVCSPPSESTRRPPPRDPRTPLGSQTIFPLSLDSPASPPDHMDPADISEDEEVPHHPLTTVREISEDGRKSPEVASSSPSYVKLVYNKKSADDLSCNPLATKTITREIDRAVEVCAPATVVVAGVNVAGLAGVAGGAARFTVPAAGLAGGVVGAAGGGAGLVEAPAPHTPALTPPHTPVPTAAGSTNPPSVANCVSCTAVPGVGSPLNYASLDLEPKKGVTAPAHRTYTQIDFARSEKLHAADGN